jgi:hypothetical protein
LLYCTISVVKDEWRRKERVLSFCVLYLYGSAYYNCNCSWSRCGALTATGGVTYAGTAGGTIPASGSYGNVSVSDGLLGYWKLDETTGTVAADSSGLGHTGTHTSSPTISSDVPTLQFANPRSLDFDGSTNYVDLGTPAFLNNQFAGKNKSGFGRLVLLK